MNLAANGTRNARATVAERDDGRNSAPVSLRDWSGQNKPIDGLY